MMLAGGDCDDDGGDGGCDDDDDGGGCDDVDGDGGWAGARVSTAAPRR